ncbi:MAG: hypothetical protein WBR21_16445 [Rouxiella badensis]|jgi:hypothetical protein|uniref:Uncharacterized protein n=1 Tax=Rouxiella badensis TaxID=1646377 RepID=A0A1X0WAF3_9GAMM|nr:hypothetical protein [Rouxiella badensis]ORJ23768.1 hypothetical protein BS640_19720 [Rouxiella badensis]QOI54807.1 hypothetical protein H2866_18045 [Rouxiella badensis subsp. acadiensis]WAT04102.1 hypothetical protein O1V64_17885 [Rouxiella badensis]
MAFIDGQLLTAAQLNDLANKSDLDSAIEAKIDEINGYNLSAAQSADAAASNSASAQSAVALAQQAAAEALAAEDVLRSELAAPAGAGLSGYQIGQTYGANTVGTKLNRRIDIEDFADENSEAGDWTIAIQAAINQSLIDGSDVYGRGNYTISNTLKIAGFASQGLNLYLNSLSVNSAFPKCDSFWDSPTPMILIGDGGANVTGLNITIGTLHGGIYNASSGDIEYIADGIKPNGNGFALSHFHIGYALYCYAVIRTGDQLTPNASMWITGDFWTQNYLGVLMKTGTGSGAPIVEGWKFFVKFIAANNYGGIWFLNSGQYAQVNGDFDFNGGWLGILHLSDTTYVSELVGNAGEMLTDGTTQLAFMAHYTYQGSNYVIVAADRPMSDYGGGTGTFPWAAGSTITSVKASDIAIKFDKAMLAGDNASSNNFIDIIHDFQYTAFGKIQVVAGYLAGVYGGLLHSSVFLYQNSFDGVTQIVDGMAVSNSGTTLSFYNKTVSDSPYSNITADFVNFEKRLYLKDHTTIGINTYIAVPRATSADDFTTILPLTDTSTDKYGEEGSKWHVEIISNYSGCGGSHDVYIWGVGNARVTNQQQLGYAYEWRYMQQANADGTAISGINLQIRQDSQDVIKFSVNMTRIG